MNNSSICVPRVARAFLLLATACCASPALADHLGPSGFGSGGGSSVFGPDTLDEAHWAASLRLTYTRPEQRSDATLAQLAAEHIHAHNTDYSARAGIGLAWGVTHHLTVAAELPYVRRDDLRESAHAHVGGVSVNGVERLGTVAGVGDMSLLAKYRVTEGDREGLALIAGIKLPTGSTHKRSPDGERLETEHQPGTGSWDPIVGLSASLPLESLTLSASGLYQLSRRGAQRTRLGDRAQGGIALSHRFGERSPAHAQSHNHHHGDELDHHEERPRSSWDAFVEIAGEWEGRQKIAGVAEPESGGAWAYVAPGVRFNASSGWSASAALALPLWQHIRASHPDNKWRVVLSLARGF
jgi:hypothetical protein